MTTNTRAVDRRLWLVSVAVIVAILAVVYILSGAPHDGNPIAVRLVVAVIVTACTAVAKVAAGTRAAAVTAVVGVLIAIVVLKQMG
jgi:uncharacterized membrane protein